MKIQCIRFDPYAGDVVDVLETVDISRCGMGVMSDRYFYPGQRVLLCMPMTSVGGRRNIYATVVRCQQTEEGYKTGMEFDTVSMGLWEAADNQAAAA